MIPFFTIFMVVFIIILTIGLRKNSGAQEEAQERFWQREYEANHVRKADISNLDYITIPSDIFPQEPKTDAEARLKELSGKTILDLTGLSNTDLKMQYGVANLQALSEYDANFTALVVALGDYGKELLDAGRIPEAQKVLEYAVSIHADSGIIYTMLADIYKEQGQKARISELIASAKELKSLSRDSIVTKLTGYLPYSE